MGKHRLVILLLVSLLLPLALITGARAESRLVWSFDWEGFDVEVFAPYQAYAGDTLTIGVRTEAKKALRDVSVEIRLYGAKLEGYDAWTTTIIVLDGERLSDGVVLEQDFNVSLPSDVSPGLLYGHMYCGWKVGKTYFYLPRELDASFTVTYLKNKAYEDLQVTYSNLLNDYEALLANYSDLVDYYNALSAEYVALNVTYYELLDTYHQLQSDHNSTDYASLNATYYDLLGTYHQLQSDYSSLQGSSDIRDNNYDNLLINYDALHAKWEDLKSKIEAAKTTLGTTSNLSYILMVTTIIFLATTVYLAMRKPEVKLERDTT